MLQGLHGSLSKSADPQGGGEDLDSVLLRLIETAAAERGIALDEPEWEPPAFVPPRNAMHAFFLPFESLIIDPPRYAGRIEGYLCSTSLPAIWRMLNEEASGTVIRDAWIKAELERDDQSEDYYRGVTSEMHAAARVVVDEIAGRLRDDEGARRTMIARLGGEAVYGDFCEMRRLLPLVLAYQDAFSGLRALVARYDRERAAELAEGILTASADRPALCACLQLGVLSNLEMPWQGLWLHHALNARINTQDEGEPSVIAGHLTATLELQLQWLESRLNAEETDAVALDPFIGFSELLSGMIRHRSFIGDPEILHRLEVLVAAGGEMFERLIETAARALEAVLPVSEGEDGAAPDFAGLTERADVKKLIRAGHDAALFVQAGETMAPLYGKTGVWQNVHEETVQIVQRYVSRVAVMLAGMASDARGEMAAKADYLLPVAELLADRATLEPLQRVLGQGGGAA